MFRIFAIIALLLPIALPAQTMRPRDVDNLPSTPVAVTVPYGSDPLQVADLRLPPGKGPFPVVIVIHGGCWTKGFATRQNTAALASALTAQGFATYNIEYRQLGDPGAGWPGTFTDWASATDSLRSLAKTQPLDLERVATAGHSAGAEAALWVASRPKLPVSDSIRGANPLPIRAAVVIDGPPEVEPFIGFDAQVCGQPVIEPLFGGSPAEQPGRYLDASPAQHLPLGVAQLLVSSAVLPAKDADAYRAKARAAGDPVEVLKVENGGHFDIIAPGSEAWKTVGPAIVKFLREADGKPKRTAN